MRNQAVTQTVRLTRGFDFGQSIPASPRAIGSKPYGFMEASCVIVGHSGVVNFKMKGWEAGEHTPS